MEFASVGAQHPEHRWVKPERRLLSPPDLDKFKNSPVCKEVMVFVLRCSESVTGVPLSAVAAVKLPSDSPVVKIEAFMDELTELVASTPPLQQPMRFGNKAFRTWHDRLVERVPSFLATLLPPDLAGASIELGPYLEGCFGNETRIDYGTGHEAVFVLFLLALFKLRIFVEADFQLVVLRCFAAYLRCVRRLQKDYVLEPAGSHGVWGLDDYHCLLFLWGAAQLRGHPDLDPSSVHNDALLEAHKADWFYLQGISFIKDIKSSAPFAETSPMLNDISALPDWARVHKGMMKLFEGEVLFKFPVIQHFLFGSIISADWEPTPMELGQRPSNGAIPGLGVGMGMMPGMMMSSRPGGLARPSHPQL